MNDPAVKLALVLSILLGGFLAALAFRSDRTVSPSAAPTLSELAALRNRRPPEKSVSAAQGNDDACASVRRQRSELNSTSPVTVLRPLDNPPPVEPLSQKYPGDGSTSSTGWGMPIVSAQGSEPTERTPRIHTIVDGDTLPALAEKYLGSRDRAMEIFKANREVLSDPELLPIGVELKIP